TQPDIAKSPRWEAPDWMESAKAPDHARTSHDAPEDDDKGGDTTWFSGAFDEKEAALSAGWMGTKLLPTSEDQSEAMPSWTKDEALEQAFSPERSEWGSEGEAMDMPRPADEAEEPAGPDQPTSIFKAKVTHFKLDTRELGNAGP